MKIETGFTRQHISDKRGSKSIGVGDRIKSWVGIAALWGGVAGLLFAPGVLVTPALALAGLRGPVASCLGGALAGAIFLGVVAAAVAIGIHAAARYDQVGKS